MKIEYKNFLNQTKIRICQNLMLKTIITIFRQFENILYFERFKCLVLGLVWFVNLRLSKIRLNKFRLCKVKLVKVRLGKTKRK
jgi:hypothetical protein